VLGRFRQKQQAKLWHDYGPTLTAEELAEDYRIQVSRETSPRSVVVCQTVFPVNVVAELFSGAAQQLERETNITVSFISSEVVAVSFPDSAPLSR